MKEVKTSKAMMPYIIAVLQRDHIPFEIRPGEKIFLPETSNRGFTIVLEDALCEKQRENTQNKLPVYSYRTIRNPKKLERLRKLNGRRGFHYLKQDKEKCRAYFNY